MKTHRESDKRPSPSRRAWAHDWRRGLGAIRFGHVACAAALLVIALAAAPLHADEWGTLRGRLVVDGDVPKLDPVATADVLAKDPFCEKCELVNETIVVGEKGGLQNAVIYLRTRRGATVAVHPDYQEPAAEPIELVNKNCRFEPRVVLLRTGQKLRVKNADETAHNTKFDFIKNNPINQVIAAGDAFTKTFAEAESLPLPVSCNIHPFMSGYVLIRSDPYMVVTDKEGRFELNHLPKGEHQFQFWHESGYLKDMALEKAATDRRGRVRLTITAGEELDLGEIRVPVELLTR